MIFSDSNSVSRLIGTSSSREMKFTIIRLVIHNQVKIVKEIQHIEIVVTTNRQSDFNFA